MVPSASRTSILVLDAPESAEELASCLAQAGYEVVTCHEAAGALAALAEQTFGAVLCDPEAVELELNQAARVPGEPPAWIELAGFGSVEDAVLSVQRGAADYICKPFSDEQVLMAVARALDQRTLRRENQNLKQRLADRFGIGKLVTRDPEVQRILQSVEAVADTRATILIEGESGTGKTLLARTVHQLSGRRDGPFVEVNCGALPDTLLESELFGHVKGSFTGATRDKVGKFEAADGGTIFLDEIGTATPDLQVKLLRVLQDRVYERLGDNAARTTDVRVIAATNADLLAAVRAGTFREDLYWRLRVIAFELPPLRARPTDVALLAEQFVARFALEHARGAKRLSTRAVARLVAHDWPGNIRELEHAIERAVLLSASENIEAIDLGFEPAVRPPGATETRPEHDALYQPGTPLRTLLEAPERAILEAALRHSGGNRKETARTLDINRTTLFNKMRKYNLMEFDGSSE